MATVANIKAKLSLDNKEFKKGIKDSESQTSEFGGAMSKLGPIIGAAFSVGAVIAFGKELALISKKTENVKRAFDRLDGLELRDLRSATGGMVSDFELMQKAVQAVNLGINQNNLAKYFEFATIRAAETGEEVDYLVNSIVTGIGRKSTMILDNLGISAIELQEEVKKVGDFATAAGNIIEREMGKSTTSVDDVTSGVVMMQTEWTNLVDHIANSGLGNQLDEIAKSFAKVLKMMRGGAFKENVFEDAATGLATNIQLYNDAFERGHFEQMRMYAKGIANWTTALGIETDMAVKAAQNAANEIADIEPSSIKKVQRLDISGEQIDPNQGYTDYTTYLGDSATKAAGDVAILTNAMTELQETSIEPPSAEDIKAWEALGETMVSFGKIMGDVVANAIMLAADALVDIVTGGNILDAFKDFITSMGKMMAQYGALLMAQGVAQKAFEGGGATTKIIAGAAMLALGLAISAGGAAINSSGAGGGAGGGSYSSSTGSDSEYDNNREIILVARGNDLVGVLNSTNQKQSYLGGV